MPYHEASFLDGLACGLTATNGLPRGQTVRTLLTGTRRTDSSFRYSDRQSLENSLGGGPYDASDLGIGDAAPGAFVSAIDIRTDSAASIVYEYGAADSLQKSFREVKASAELQTFYHVWPFPDAVPWGYYYNQTAIGQAFQGILTELKYNVYLLIRRGANHRFRARFTAYPFYETPIVKRYGLNVYTLGEIIPYPGSPELAQNWLTVTVY